jgi:hypothetical protein
MRLIGFWPLPVRGDPCPGGLDTVPLLWFLGFAINPNYGAREQQSAKRGGKSERKKVCEKEMTKTQTRKR